MIGPADMLGWAKKPRSREAMAQVQELAGRDRRFVAIWERLLRIGAVSAEGAVRLLWNGTQWVKVDE